MVEPGGWGPWFCGLLFNTSRDSKKQTHVVAHTNLGLITSILNRNTDINANGAGWVVMVKIGPFESWSACIAAVAMWTNRTRGRSRRLVRAFTILEAFRDAGVTMWCLNEPLPKIIERRKRDRERHAQVLPPTASTMATGHNSSSVESQLEHFRCAFQEGGTTIGALRVVK